MSRRCSESETIFRLAKMFIAQYIHTVEGFEAFQEEAVDLLTEYMIKIIKGLALQVKKILDMQGRTLSNPLHLLATAHQLQFIDFQDLLRFINTRKDTFYKQFDILRKCMERLLRNDASTLNRCRPCSQLSNIRYLPTVYTVSIDEKALPYRHPVCDTVPKPMEMTYKSTKTVLQRSIGSIQTLETYQRRQIKKAMLGFEKRTVSNRAASRKLQEKEKFRHNLLLLTQKDCQPLKSTQKIKDHRDTADSNDQQIGYKQESKGQLERKSPQDQPFNQKFEEENADKIDQPRYIVEKGQQTPKKPPSQVVELTKSKSRHSETSNECEYNPIHRPLTLYGRQITQYGRVLGDEEAPRSGKKNKFDLISYL